MFERGILCKGSSKLKVLFIVHFELKSGGPGNFMLSVKFFFLLRVIGFSYLNFD